MAEGPPIPASMGRYQRTLRGLDLRIPVLSG